jgi:hypothetical protein
MEFAVGDAIRISTETVDYADEPTTPDTSIVVKIDRNGVEILAPTAMTNDGTGLHYYVWQSAADADTGKYEVYITCVDGGITSIEHDRRAFYLYD